MDNFEKSLKWQKGIMDNHNDDLIRGIRSREIEVSGLIKLLRSELDKIHQKDEFSTKVLEHIQMLKDYLDQSSDTHFVSRKLLVSLNKVSTLIEGKKQEYENRQSFSKRAFKLNQQELGTVQALKESLLEYPVNLN